MPILPTSPPFYLHIALYCAILLRYAHLRRHLSKLLNLGSLPYKKILFVRTISTQKTTRLLFRISLPCPLSEFLSPFFSSAACFQRTPSLVKLRIVPRKRTMPHLLRQTLLKRPSKMAKPLKQSPTHQTCPPQSLQAHHRGAPSGWSCSA